MRQDDSEQHCNISAGVQEAVELGKIEILLDMMQGEPKISYAPQHTALEALNGYPPLAAPTSRLQVVIPDLAFIEVTALGRDQKLVEDDDVAQMWPFWSLSSNQEAGFVVPSHMAPETVVLWPYQVCSGHLGLQMPRTSVSHSVMRSVTNPVSNLGCLRSSQLSRHPACACILMPMAAGQVW